MWIIKVASGCIVHVTHKNSMCTVLYSLSHCISITHLGFIIRFNFCTLNVRSSHNFRIIKIPDPLCTINPKSTLWTMFICFKRKVFVQSLNIMYVTLLTIRCKYNRQQTSQLNQTFQFVAEM